MLPIDKVHIENFKSIESLDFGCRRINLLLGEPNVGKSNILEALSFTSNVKWRRHVRSWVRMQSMLDLFHNRNIESQVRINLGRTMTRLSYRGGQYEQSFAENNVQFFAAANYNVDGTYSGGMATPIPALFDKLKFYRFSVRESFPDQNAGPLIPPDGPNLLSVLLTNKTLREQVKALFVKFNLRIVLKPRESIIETQIEPEEDVAIAFPYSISSDTLQRVVFFLAAIESNKGSVLLLEEPEAHAFPYYAKYIAERIAQNRDNQYFITTHNPYFVLSILEKTPKDEVAVFRVYFEQFQTKMKMLSEKGVDEILNEGVDAFFNLSNLAS